MEFPRHLATLADEMATWPDVTAKAMFGGWAFMVEAKMFAFSGGEDIVIKLPDGPREQALHTTPGRPFRHNNAPFGNWVQFQPASAEEGLTPWVRTAYESVKAGPAPKKRKNPRKRRLF